MNPAQQLEALDAVANIRDLLIMLTSEAHNLQVQQQVTLTPVFDIAHLIGGQLDKIAGACLPQGRTTGDLILEAVA